MAGIEDQTNKFFRGKDQVELQNGITDTWNWNKYLWITTLLKSGIIIPNSEGIKPDKFQLN